MKKYIFLVQGFGVGGVEKVIIELAKGFQNKNCNVTVVTYGSFTPLLVSELLDEKINFIHVAGPIQAAKLIWKMNHTSPLDLIYSFMTPANVLACMLRITFGIPFVASIHLHPSAFEREDVLRRLLRPILYKFFIFYSVKTICVSAGVFKAVSLLSKREKKLLIIYNPIIGQNFFTRAAETFSLPTNFIGKKIISGCGRIEHQKGFDLLIAAFELTLKKIPDARLVIIGDGSKKENIISQARNLGIDDKIYITGLLKNPLPYIKASSLFVLSSRYEGFGNVLAEALSLNCKCVSFDCPSGPYDILDGGKYGQLVPPEDVQCLSVAMIRDLANPSNIDEALLTEHIRKFKTSNVVDKYLTLKSQQ